jgi:hypothetical protein
MVDENRLYEEMYIRICEETACRSCARWVLSGAGVVTESGGDLDRAERWASVATDNPMLRTR